MKRILQFCCLALFTLGACKKVVDKPAFMCECTGSITAIPTAKGYLMAPNVFSPNGDGKNDNYRFLIAAGIQVDSFFMKISFPAKGDVYTSKNIFESWDGTVKNGDNTPSIISGKYYMNYIIKTKTGERFMGCQCIDICTYSASDDCILNPKDYWRFADQCNLSTGQAVLLSAEKFCE